MQALTGRAWARRRSAGSGCPCGRSHGCSSFNGARLMAPGSRDGGRRGAPQTSRRQPLDLVSPLGCRPTTWRNRTPSRSVWECITRDSNPHAARHRVLSPSRLPFRQRCMRIIAHTRQIRKPAPSPPTRPQRTPDLRGLSSGYQISRPPRRRRSLLCCVTVPARSNAGNQPTVSPNQKDGRHGGVGVEAGGSRACIHAHRSITSRLRRLCSTAATSSSRCPTQRA